MGIKMKLQFLCKNQSKSSSSSSWSWPSCTQTRTLSFRTNNHEMFKTINSTYLDKSALEAFEPPESFFTTSESASFSSTSEDYIASGGCDPIEAAIKGIKSERLFFEPGVTSSILTDVSNNTIVVEYDTRIFKESSLVLSIESKDPYLDFKKSMEEMVESHGLKDWEELEELFSWYLKSNEKNNHGFIIGAFVDLLVGVAFKSYNNLCTCCNSPSSPLSFCCNSSWSFSSFSSTPNCVSSIEAEDETETSPCLSSLLEEEETEEEDEEEEEDAS